MKLPLIARATFAAAFLLSDRVAAAVYPVRDGKALKPVIPEEKQQ